MNAFPGTMERNSPQQLLVDGSVETVTSYTMALYILIHEKEFTPTRLQFCAYSNKVMGYLTARAMIRTTITHYWPRGQVFPFLDTHPKILFMRLPYQARRSSLVPHPMEC